MSVMKLVIGSAMGDLSPGWSLVACCWDVLDAPQHKVSPGVGEEVCRGWQESLPAHDLWFDRICCETRDWNARRRGSPRRNCSVRSRSKPATGAWNARNVTRHRRS